ncbi:MAG: CCA tRNA nucleotidyltransferase [Aquificae bacterium]|nr:CCA tRNA nucleotidyltransferase [Aquificota bacterium]
MKRYLAFPSHLVDVARKIGRISDSLGFRVYAVGGVVRDIILGRDVWDVDFVVEGDAIRVAEELARSEGVRAHTFERFGTAHLKLGRLKVELARARREVYPEPGAYPLVEPASLEEDLRRRDFTVNAMALSVNPEDFGLLIDPLGGFFDLQKGILRILHPRSFVEDPVRIQRALRFAGRFGFLLSPSTERRLTEAVGLIGKAPRGRVLGELKLALREKRPLAVLELYKHYGVLGEVLGGFVWEDWLMRGIEEVSELHSERFPSERLQYGWLYVVALRPSEGERFFEEIGAPSFSREASFFFKRDFRNVLKRLRFARSRYEVYRTLKSLPLGALLLLGAERSVRGKVFDFLENLRFFKVPRERVEELMKLGYRGKELGEKIEELKRELMG